MSQCSVASRGGDSDGIGIEFLVKNTEGCLGWGVVAERGQCGVGENRIEYF